MENVICFFNDDDGASAVEYSILAALIAAVIIGTVFVLGEQVKGLFDLTLAEMTNSGI